MIDSKDPIFDILLGRRRAADGRLDGRNVNRAWKASEEVDRAVYDEE